MYYEEVPVGPFSLAPNGVSAVLIARIKKFLKYNLVALMRDQKRFLGDALYVLHTFTASYRSITTSSSLLTTNTSYFAVTEAFWLCEVAAWGTGGG